MQNRTSTTLGMTSLGTEDPHAQAFRCGGLQVEPAPGVGHPRRKSTQTEDPPSQTEDGAPPEERQKRRSGDRRSQERREIHRADTARCKTVPRLTLGPVRTSGMQRAQMTPLMTEAE